MYPICQVGILLNFTCNRFCRSCEKLCNLDAITGVSSLDGEMTRAELDIILDQIEAVSTTLDDHLVTRSLAFSGGEPTLHPQLSEFLDAAVERLEKPGIVGKVIVVTNGTNPTHPTYARHVTWTSMRDKPNQHVAFFADQAAMTRRVPVTFATCCDHRKAQVTVSHWGWNRCCGALGYVRMLCADDAMAPRLPLTEDGWPNMDDVCAVCAFGNCAPLERHVGRPFAPRFQWEAAWNKAGRKLGTKLEVTK